MIPADTVIGIGLAVSSTTLTNLAYLREHDAAAALPALSMRRPLHSAALLLHNRSWLLGFTMETGGFLLYAAALALTSLALVQSIAAGGIGVLAVVSARIKGRRLPNRQRAGVGLSILGLAALGVSLSNGTGGGAGGNGSVAVILLWIGASCALALVVLVGGRRRGQPAIAEGIAGGLFFSVGDFSTKLATAGGARAGFAVTLIIGYALGTSLLQLGYQRGGAVTVAGLATLLTNALPIVAGTVVLGEPVPGGVLGALRVLAFVAVTAGAILLAAPDHPRNQQRDQRGDQAGDQRGGRRRDRPGSGGAGDASATPATASGPRPGPGRPGSRA